MTEAMGLPVSALDAPFSLSVLTVTRGHASKQIVAGANEQPIKGEGSLAIARGLIEHVTVQGLAGLQALLAGIRHNQVLVHGVVKGSHPGDVHPIVPTDTLKQAAPGSFSAETIARSLEYISHPEDLYLLMFDRDDNAADPTKLTTAEELFTLLAPLFPGIETAGRVVTRSTSSAIRDKQTHDWLIPPAGFHAYLLVRGDLARFVEILTARLWNAGYGYCMLATPNKQTGVAAVLSRVAVDVTVFSPERLDYAAGARIAKHAPFYQDRGRPELRPGGILDLDSFPDLTAEERKTYSTRLAEAKAVLAPERFQQVKAVVEAADPTLTPAQVETIVHQYLEHHEGGFLAPDFLVQFYHRKVAVHVGDLSKEYDGLRLADPAEPDYRDGTDAVFHWRGGDWRINSFAHGVLRTYQAVPTPPPHPDDDDMQNLLQHIPLDAATKRKGRGASMPNTSNAQEDPRPLIRLGPNITQMVDAGEAALLALPRGPVLFQRARRLCVIARGLKPPKWLHRPADAPVIVEAKDAYLDELAAQAARWEKFDKREEVWYEVTPPSRFAKTLCARPAWGFPLLEGIIHSPTLRPDGSILHKPGYDAKTALFFDSNGTTFPGIRARVTLDDARTAIGCLQEVTRDFPFACTCHFSGWLSAVLSVVCRYTIIGCVPLHGITATIRGSGKSLLADTIALIGTGYTAARWAQVFDEDEERKRLLSLALDGDPLVCIDNVTAPLGSGALAGALTASSIKDRLLGANQTKEAPLSTVFLCTGNNMQYVGDVARRVVPIAIDPVMERPEERTTFQHTPLLAWVATQRPQLTMAALTIVKAYCDAGKPSQGLTPLGSFEAWSTLIRHALVWAGEADPCEGRKELEAISNPEFETLTVLLHAWHACYETKAVTLAQMAEDCTRKMQHIGPESTANEWNHLHAALVACDKRSDGKQINATRIGNAMRGWQGRVIDDMRLLALPMKASGGKALWKVDVLPTA
jgi:hypothetical protein